MLMPCAVGPHRPILGSGVSSALAAGAAKKPSLSGIKLFYLSRYVHVLPTFYLVLWRVAQNAYVICPPWASCSNADGAFPDSNFRRTFLGVIIAIKWPHGDQALQDL